MAALVIVLIALDTAMVWWTGGTQFAYLHLLYVPVVVSGLALGLPGGILAGVAAGLAVGPLMPLDVAQATAQPTLGWVLRTLAFVMVGALVGAGQGLLHARLRDTEQLLDVEQRLRRAQQQRHDLAQQVLEDGARERNRLALHVHNEVVGHLVAARHRHEAGAAYLARGDADRADTLFAQAVCTLDSGIAECRQLLDRLRSSILEPGTLTQAIGANLDDIAREHGLCTQLDLPDGELTALSLPVELLLYETARNALANVTRHAHATTVTVRLVSCPVVPLRNFVFQEFWCRGGVGPGRTPTQEALMARRGRPTVTIELTEQERETLQRWTRRHSSAQALALRSRIVLGCDEGLTNGQVAQREGCHPTTVSKWRHRFAADRLEGLVDAPRPGAARTVSDEVVEAVVIDTLETAPADATHWSTRGLAGKHGISKTTVAEIWRAFGLKPWRQDSFKVSPDPDLIDKVRDIVGLYLNPPDAAIVFAVDEKPQIQALNRTAPTLPMLPTTPARATHDYQRNGTVDLFAALDIAAGTVTTDIRPSHTSKDFVAFLNKINREVLLSLLTIPAGKLPTTGGRCAHLPVSF